MEIPRICPMPACGELVPQSPDKFLLSLFKKHHDRTELLKQGKKLGGRVHHLYEICTAITEHGQQDISTTASENGWPLEIDFENLPDRIMNVNIRKKIEGVIANEFVLDDTPSWKNFVSLIKAANYTLVDFQRLDQWGKFRVVGANAHAG
jgi:hypothetical protein